MSVNERKVRKYAKSCKKLKISERGRKGLKYAKSHEISKISENMQKVMNS